MSQESGKSCLPNGWIVRVSSKFPDRIYYFNTLTGNSTWECPELAPRRLSNGKEESQKRLSGGQTNIVGSFSARSSHTPEEILSFKKLPSVSMQKNTYISKKRSLEIDTPTTSRSSNSPGEIFSFHKPSTGNVHNQDKSKESQLKTDTPTTSQSINSPELFSFHKPSSASIHDQNKSRVRQSGIGAPSTSNTDISKGIKIPTAIVAPVIGRRKERKRNRRKTKSKQKGNVVPTAVALPLTVEAKQMLENQHKRLRTSSPLRQELVTGQNQPTFNASTSYETRSTDSDMEFDFGASSNVNAIPSTSRENTGIEPNANWAEVEMLDVSADLTSLDEIVPAKDPNQLNSYYIVVDTNVLIHDMTHIEEIRETPLQGCGPPHIIIPWVVFQELDRMKCYNDTPGKLAQKAVRYLFKILKSKHPRFHGQSGEEAHKLKREYHDSNDDKIIDLCLSLRTKMKPEKVILMTNDKNLANKAMTYEVIVHDWASLLKDITPDIPIQAAPLKKKKQKKKCNNESVPAIMSKERQKLVNEHSNYEKDIDSLMADARQMLKNVLDPFLLQEMQKVYGPAWERFQIDRRLLREILAAYIKFWPTVFYAHFSNKLKNSFELLHQKAISPEGLNGNSEDCLLVFHAIEDIFRAIVKVQPNMSSLIGNIQSLQENYAFISSKCSNVHSSICDMDKAITISEGNLVLEVLNFNWNVINEICGMVMDFYGVPHTFQYPKPQSIPAESEYRRVVADLYPSLLQLKTQLKKVIGHVINSTYSKPSFTRLVAGLKQLIPSLKIQAVMPDMNNLTGKSMEEFCRKPENRQKIECGYQQLENFCDKLNEAIQAMISFKKNRPNTS